MAQNQFNYFGASDDDERRSRFSPSVFDSAGLGSLGGNGHGPIGSGGPASLRERAASQPPHSHSSEQNFLASPLATQFIPSSLGGGTATSPWATSRPYMGPAASNRNNQPMPIRSSSFSTNSQSQFSSAMRDRVFPSMFEDDESDTDTYDERLVPPSLGRGRTFGNDPTRSRSQSLATGRVGTIGSGYLGSSTMNSWNDSFLSNNTSSPLAIPGRFGEIKPPGQSRYGSLGTIGRSPNNNPFSSSPSNGLLGNGLNAANRISETNQSPFRRDVGQILLDDGSAFRELWAGMNPPKDENGGGGSGTTSRRHSVSVVQPRKGGIVGFNAPGQEFPDEVPAPRLSGLGGGFGRSAVKISDDDLLADLGSMNLGPSNDSHASTLPPSQPSSLPIFAPLSRSPPSRDLLSPYQTMNLNISGSYTSRQSLGTPTDDYLNDEGYGYEQYTQQSHYMQQHQHQDVIGRSISGQGYNNYNSGGGSNQVPYLRQRGSSFSSGNGGPPGLNNQSPISPTRMVNNPQQQPYFPQQIQRRPSEPPLTPLSQPPSASTNLTNPPLPGQGGNNNQNGGLGNGGGGQQAAQQPNINDLGKGVPLHSVPPLCPLFIVEFKAGRTDLFYLLDTSLEIKLGDLVVVEADRGKDLGTVVNDTITVGEVESWQRQQAEKAAEAAAAAVAMGYGGGGGGGGSGGVPSSPDVGPLSPGGSNQVTTGVGGQQGSSKKEINPKLILGRAGQQDSALLAVKTQDELKALQLCQSKVKAKKLPMEVIDAEYQWDRRKLTFYFVAEKRIDFRELVRELFRLYKTRIWMASIQGGIPFEQ